MERCRRFADCAHAREPGCAVTAAVQRGQLDDERRRRYQKLQKETAFHDLTYAEKRHKDKAFGKMARAVMKGKER